MLEDSTKQNHFANFRIFARAVIINEKNAVLMVKKKEDQKIAPGQWVLPGGAIEHGELPEEALKRELIEEINFIPQTFQLIASETRVIGETHWVGLIYKAQGDLSSITNGEPDKHSALQWCTHEFLKKELSSDEYRRFCLLPL